MKGGDNMINKYNKFLMGFAGSALAISMGSVALAADYTASTTAAINSAGESILGMFFTNLPVILTFVIAIVVTLWGIRWVMSHLRGGRR